MGPIKVGNPTEQTGTKKPCFYTAFYSLGVNNLILLNMYDVELKYIRDLHNADSNVISQSPQISKDTRRYLGIVIMLNGQKYCIPFSSGQKDKYQSKKSNIDLIKIPDVEKKNNNGAYVTMAVLNLNNMIPVDESLITKVDLRMLKTDDYAQQRRKRLLQKELAWCRENAELIVRRAQKVYNIVTETPEKSHMLIKRCCNFKKLEDAMRRYLTKHK